MDFEKSMLCVFFNFFYDDIKCMNKFNVKNFLLIGVDMETSPGPGRGPSPVPE
jgi:hypothetical protein